LQLKLKEHRWPARLQSKIISIPEGHFQQQQQQQQHMREGESPKILNFNVGQQQHQQQDWIFSFARR